MIENKPTTTATHPKPHRTWQVTRPLGRTLMWTLVTLVVLALSVEVIVRTPFAQERLPVPSWGMSLRKSEYKIFLLEQYAAEHNGVDCLFLGSSMVNRGMDPHAFSTTFQEITGDPLECFNLGLNALRGSDLDLLADYLFQKYQPRLIIYGTSLRDYKSDREARNPVVDNPWMQYRLGDFSLQGWLADSSDAYKYWLLVNSWKGQDFPERYQFDMARKKVFRPDGFDPMQGHQDGLDITTSPDPQTEARFFEKLYPFHTDQSYDFTGLAAFLQLCSQQGTSVLIIEMPVHATFFDFFADDPALYDRFVTLVGQTSEGQDIQFWPTSKLWLVPTSGFFNRNHFNTAGAQIFSAWLGRQVGLAVENLALVLPDK